MSIANALEAVNLIVIGALIPVARWAVGRNAREKQELMSRLSSLEKSTALLQAEVMRIERWVKWMVEHSNLPF